MRKSFDHKSIEDKWNKQFEKEAVTLTDLSKSDDSYYCLDMFPYPSGYALHVGHWRGYVLSDYFARFMRLKGKNVLHPMGFDAFGLPAENAAIQNKSHPKEFTDVAITKFRTQFDKIGALYDWTKVVNTSDPSYYRWTQWLFLQLFKHGLAEKREAPVNWCPKDKTVLANEQVVDGKCERCGTVVVRKNLSQWYLKITDFAEELLSGLDKLDWPENVKALQRNWIGKSVGTEVVFHSPTGKISVFTTRADTIFGVSAIVLAPEHPMLEKLTSPAHKDAVSNYVEQTKTKSEIDRQLVGKGTKTGVFTGSHAQHPLTKKDIPIWVADYVLPGYGSGAVMSVPAHDKRDFDFATAHQLPIINVVQPEFVDRKEPGYVRDDQPFVERDGIVAIVKHWSEDKYLGLKWKQVAWGTWITGGIENNQTAETAARSEILEETGYKNLSLVKDLGVLHSKFYHEPKKENRFLHGRVLCFELKNSEQVKVNDKEVAIHDQVWLKRDEVEKFMTADAHKWAWGQLIGEPILTDETGYLIDSGVYSGLSSDDATKKITADLTKKGLGGKKTVYRLRDWLVSRQRYWGAPIPIVYDPEGKAHPVKDEHLPLLLPEDVDFQPGGESPIARSSEYKKRAEKLYGKGWHFETDTLDTFVDSSWYYLRYLSNTDQTQAFSKAEVSKWLPIDLYIGGIEHAILHLLYSRFICHFLASRGYIDKTLREPFSQLFSIGMITLKGSKMSKSKGNIISPDELIEHYGTDALRGYELFIGPLDVEAEWNQRGINGVHRLLVKLNGLIAKITDKPDKKQKDAFDEYLVSVEGMVDGFRLNTVISEIMKLSNLLGKSSHIDKEVFKRFVVSLEPVFPYISEHLWNELGGKDLIIKSGRWPIKFSDRTKKSLLKVLVNQKFATDLEMSEDNSEAAVLRVASDNPIVKSKLSNRKVVRTVYKPGSLLNIITN